MVEVNLAAKRYAQAAFELANERNAAGEWRAALDQIAEFMLDAEVRRVLENTRMPREAKLQLVEAALGGLPPLPLNFARLLARKGRTALARDIASHFAGLVESRQGIARARAVTAVPLSDAEQQQLRERLEQQTGQAIVLETEVDSRILGGVVVQVGDRLVDASTRGKLAALREAMAGAL
jgi:F-type H+-transporting ATPase subunit delta